MKRLIAFAALAIATTSAFANPHYNYHQNRGVRPLEAIVLGGLGAVIVNEVYRANQPRVIVQPVPVYPPVYYQAQQPTNNCHLVEYHAGQYNPAAAQAYCRGQYQRQLEIEAYQRGLSGQ